MPNISAHHSASATKILVLGDSGSGKTGALASLAAAGYNLRIIDVDNGVDVLHSLLDGPKSQYPKDASQRVEFETVTDSMRLMGGRIVPVKASAWQRSLELMENWKTASLDAGNLHSWTERDVLVIDTLSILASHALKFILSLNMRLGQRPHQSDWGEAQALVEGLLEKLYDSAVKCNVVVNCHIKYIEDDITGAMRCFPESVGRALSPKIGRYFNNVIRAQTVGKLHKLSTVSTGQLELKTSAPLSVKPEYPIETGLADLFRDLQSTPATRQPPVVSATATAASVSAGKN